MYNQPQYLEETEEEYEPTEEGTSYLFNLSRNPWIRQVSRYEPRRR